MTNFHSVKNVFCWISIVFILSVACKPGAPGEIKYPDRPISYIVPWAAGGMTDVSSRILASFLSTELGTSVNVINRTGGGGIIGHLAISNARSDGYTLGAVTVDITQLRHLGLTDLSYKEFTPLALVIDNPAAITVSASSPYQTIDELITFIKSNPGVLQASGTARGGIWDLARVGFLRAAGLTPDHVPWVPSQGSSPALQELMAGGVDLLTVSLAEADPMRQAGQVRTLAVMSKERLPNFPDVPTLMELGINWSIGGWVSVCAPLGLPDPVKATLETALFTISKNAEFIRTLDEAGSNLRFLNGEDLRVFMEEEDETNRQLMEQSGLINRENQ